MEDEEILNDEENLVVEETNENVGEQATEQVVEGEESTSESDNSDKNIETVAEEEKKYTEKELDDILAKKIHNKERKIRREYEKKYSQYSQLENVLSAGLGTNNMQEATEKLTNFYKEQGVEIPVERHFTDREEQILAKAEADEIINSGYEDIVEEVDRLANIGYENMSTREKLVFKNLAEERKRYEEEKELLSIGADKNVLSSEKYKNFIKENGLEEVPTKKAYQLYRKLQPKPQVEQIGDLTNKNPKEDKDFISEEEYDKMTEKEIDKNFELIKKSMSKW